MSDNRWQMIEDIFHRAVTLAPEARSAFLVEACGADQSLRREVESLLAYEYESGTTFAGPAIDDVPRTIAHYRISGKLGKGGMGVVYRATDTRLGREVAIKVLPEHLAGNPQALARFEREAKAVAALSHPNILAIYDVGQEQGIRFAVTELLEGETLRDRLRSAVPWEKVVEIGAAIAEGLAAAHAKGIIHRDLKPENIFLTSEGRVKILDFGLARIQPSPSKQIGSDAPTETERGVVMGTIGYMSPEQVRGERVEAPGDIFALGCVLYEMLARRRPFAKATAAQTMAAILESQPPSLLASGKRIPVDLERLVLHCLEKNPRERFQPVHDVGLALKSIGGERPASRRHFVALWIAAALLMAALAYWRNRPGEAMQSLAVLPFAIAGSEPNMEFLGDGIAENLINSFSQLPKLRVVPRSLAFRYRGAETDPRKVGRDLNVRAVLTGRVTPHGDSLNIQAELVDVSELSQLWGRQYNRKLTEVIPVQEEIAREVSDKLGLRPTSEERKRLTKRYTENAEAHQLYLKGRYFWNRRSQESLRRAVDNFQQAIDKDSNYALAWAGLADCYAVYSMYDLLPPDAAAHKTKEAAGKALVIDETLPEPHAALGFAKSAYDWDWLGAEREFKRAIELNPNYATAHHWYSMNLAARGRLEEALKAARLAEAEDPASPAISVWVGETHYFMRRYELAIAHYGKSLEMDPNFGPAHFFLAWAYEQTGRYTEAIAALQRASSTIGEPMALGALGHAYAVSGKRAEAQKTIARLQALSQRGYLQPFEMALIYVGLGDKAQALEWLGKAVEDHTPRLLTVNIDPRFAVLHSEPGYRGLMRRMNLTP